MHCEVRDGEQCTQTTITAEAGQSVSLDARLMFVDGGASMHNQMVQLVQVIKEPQVGAGGPTPIYVCSNSEQDSSNPCPDAVGGSVTVQKEGSHKFDINLVIQNAELGAFTYTITYVVVNPRTGGQVTLVKTVPVEITDRTSEWIVLEKHICFGHIQQTLMYVCLVALGAGL